jgi:hypothetical protein
MKKVRLGFQRIFERTFENGLLGPSKIPKSFNEKGSVRFSEDS